MPATRQEPGLAGGQQAAGEQGRCINRTRHMQPLPTVYLYRIGRARKYTLAMQLHTTLTIVYGTGQAPSQLPHDLDSLDSLAPGPASILRTQGALRTLGHCGAEGCGAKPAVCDRPSWQDRPSAPEVAMIGSPSPPVADRHIHRDLAFVLGLDRRPSSHHQTTCTRGTEGPGEGWIGHKSQKPTSADPVMPASRCWLPVTA
ncbi:hypothetical protein Micbo1qcDRAFT_171568 [Microdochium bolleyi]|uniref:Uncharacterized protein n=1 Tax=Microdochium bolleyi TaxID=196109 RepID=A0A136JDB8_9PEZI|nr:hypothetical protein Micbo1qcDRAFT_171568 [Microdochium bolleyi]